MESLPQMRFITTSRFALGLLFWLVFVPCFLAPAEAAGPLSIGSTNPRFFTDPTGKAVYLTGIHLSNSLIDRSDKAVLDFTSYLNFLQQYDHNFVRLWAWEQAAWSNESSAKITFDPLAYQRRGPGTALDGRPKFDLSRFNQVYFDRLRSRVVEAGERGIYVSVMLFQGFNSQRKNMGGGNPWTGHPFNVSNNVNGINGDPSGNDNGEEVHSLTVPAITSLQETYVRKVVDALNDLDNVLYEISGDAPSSSREWQYYMINYLKSYQATKPKQHPVGMSYLHLGSTNDLLTSPADWILLPGTDTNPPLVASAKVIFSDMDPKLLGVGTSYPMIWKSFTRGLNPIYLESDLQNPSADENVRRSMENALKYSQLVDLSSMSPSSELCSSGYCLINPGLEYLVYVPLGGAVRVDLSATNGHFVASWFSPITGQTTSGGTVIAGSPALLTSPINGDAVLYLQATPALSNQRSANAAGLSAADSAPTTAAQGTSMPMAANVAAPPATVNTPTITPNDGLFVNSVTVTLQTATPGASIYYTTNGTNPTQSSTQYAAPFTLTTTSLVKAQAFKSGMTPSSQVSAWFTRDASGLIDIASMSTANDETVLNVITLAWTDSSNNEDGFGIDRKTGTNGTFAQIATVAANVNTYADSGLIAGSTYCYRVNAFNTAGASAYTNEACKAVAAPTFDFTLSNSGNKSVTQGQSVTSTITATLSSGSSQSVSFSTAGLPSGATASYTTSTSCTPTCSRTLNIATAASTPAGTYTIIVTATGGGVTRTTSFTLTVNSSTGGPPPATYTLNATPSTVQAGGTITISWTAPSGSSSKDWISLNATGAANTSYGWWQYTNGATSGSFTVPAPSTNGTYEFRYLTNDSFTSVKQSNTVTVNAGGSPPPATYTLNATPSTVQAGGTITISWTAPSGSSSKDWISLNATGAANTSYGWWQYTNGATSGSFTVPAPSTNGTYEFRYLLNDGFTSVKQSNTISKTGPTS